MKKFLLTVVMAVATCVSAFAFDMDTDVRWWVQSEEYPGEDKAVMVVYYPCNGLAFVLGYQFDASQDVTVEAMWDDFMNQTDGVFTYSGDGSTFSEISIYWDEADMTFDSSLEDCSDGYPFWMYDVNGAGAQLGYGSQTIQNGDIVAAGFVSFDYSEWPDHYCPTIDEMLDEESEYYLTEDGVIFLHDPDGPQPPATPENLKVASIAANSITISWDAVDGADKYIVYLDGVEIDENVLDTTYTFTELEDGTAYNIAVRAYSIAAHEASGYAVTNRRVMPLTPATFEDRTVGANGVYYPTMHARNFWSSGSFSFVTYYSSTYGDYFSDCVVSSLCDPTAEADYANPISYLNAACNHAAEGNNFVAWNKNYYGVEPVLVGIDLYSASQAYPCVISGMAITNTAATVNYCKNTPSFAENGCVFQLIVTGKNNGVTTGTVTFNLVDYSGEHPTYAENWQWLDLTSLGAVDQIQFNTICSDPICPEYFCFDNFGGQATDCELGEMTVENDPTTSLEGIADKKAATKTIENGTLIIVRDGVRYSATGARIF